jgi:sigma-B regulation protein RsbU (phosphoserine phosphatase)
MGDADAARGYLLGMSSPSASTEVGVTPAETVLVIDDDDHVRRAFGRILSTAGYRVSMAASGAQGLEALRESAPSAVLVDLNMPGLSGLEVLSEMAVKHAEIPVIVISGTGVIDDVVQALRRGAWDYVMKPIEDSRLLVKAVRRVVERASLLRENREQRAHLEQLNGRLTSAIEELRSDQEAGRRVQFALLPADGAKIGRYTLSRRLFPSQYLSGDFVDYFPAGDHHLVMYLADVSGHGAASAFVTAMVAALVLRHREALLRGESELVLTPDRLLESLNRDLGLRKLSKHVTMFYGVVDLRSDVLTYASAGQYPFPLVDEVDRVRVLEGSGRPLGLFADARFSRREVALGSMRRLLVPSDGILELLPDVSGQHKIDQLSAMFGGTSGVDELVQRVGIDPETHYPDDVTLLMIERSTTHG